MRSLRHVVVSIVAAVLALAALTAGVANAQPGFHGPGYKPGHGTQLRAKLDGAQEVPGPGDPDGRGFAHVFVFKDKVCAHLKVFRIDTPTAAHIHQGPAGVAGPIVVNLPTPTTGESKGCVDVNPALAENLASEPTEYYVNVHNDDFPDGAIRGQLRFAELNGD